MREKGGSDWVAEEGVGRRRRRRRRRRRAAWCDEESSRRVYRRRCQLRGKSVSIEHTTMTTFIRKCCGDNRERRNFFHADAAAHYKFFVNRNLLYRRCFIVGVCSWNRKFSCFRGGLSRGRKSGSFMLVEGGTFMQKVVHTGNGWHIRDFGDRCVVAVLSWKVVHSGSRWFIRDFGDRYVSRCYRLRKREWFIIAEHLTRGYCGDNNVRWFIIAARW